MAEWKPAPEADVEEQATPAEPAAPPNLQERVVVPADVPEADLIDQLTPSAPEPAAAAPSPGSLSRPVPEADALEQATPADRQLYNEEDY
jgi:hypothetical protein